MSISLYLAHFFGIFEKWICPLILEVMNQGSQIDFVVLKMQASADWTIIDIFFLYILNVFLANK